MDSSAGERPRPPTSSLSSRLFSLTSRCLIWFSVFTILFRCPDSPNGLSATSPYVCGPYFSVRSIVNPYVQPYYDTYAAPYVDAAWPYVDSFHDNVYAPASTFTKENYAKYAAPRVQQATALAEDQWQVIVKPRVDQVKTEVGTRYEEMLKPYVTQAFDIISPPVKTIEEFALRGYHDGLIPAYEFSIPYVTYVYYQGRIFLVNTGVPYTIWASKGTASFIRTRVWPPLRIVYGQNVEPQLAKIRQRLSSYKDGKKIEAIIDEMDESDNASFESPVAERAEEEEATDLTGTPPPPEPVQDKGSTAAPEEDAQNPTTSLPSDSKLNKDLKRWQVKFAKASDQGAEDLAARVTEIVDRQIESQVKGVGEALVTQLEEEWIRQVEGLKAIIIEAVTQLSETPSDDDQDSAYATVLANIRSTGTAIKEKAQDLRKWKTEYARETEALVRSASESTLDVIDGIRDLGLQEIGRRWATMEDVSYQDWVEYHNMKKTFDDWRVRVAAAAQEHEGLAQARSLGEDLEDRGMAIAQHAATELGRLKSVARWKIDKVDASGDFETRTLSAAAAKIGDRIKSGFADAKDRVQAGISSVKAPVESIISEASEDVPSSASEKATAIKDRVSEAASSISEEADDAIPVRESPTPTSTVTSVVSSVLSRVSDYLEPSEEPSVGSVLSAADDQFDSFTSTASSILKEAKESAVPGHAEDLSDRVASSVESIVASAGRYAGPKAQAVLSEMVSDAELAKNAATTSVESLSSSASEFASDAASKASSSVETASSIVEAARDAASDNVVAAGKSATSIAGKVTSKADDAYTQASATIRGTAGSINDDIVDKASKLSKILQKSAEKVLDTETPIVTPSI